MAKVKKKRVYIISNMKAGIVKIGVSDNCEARLITLQHCCGQKLFLWHQSKKLDNAYNIENLMHKHFKDYRTYGEWFVIGKKAAVIQLNRFLKNQD